MYPNPIIFCPFSFWHLSLPFLSFCFLPTPLSQHHLRSSFPSLPTPLPSSVLPSYLPNLYFIHLSSIVTTSKLHNTVHSQALIHFTGLLYLKRISCLLEFRKGFFSIWSLPHTGYSTSVFGTVSPVVWAHSLLGVQAETSLLSTVNIQQGQSILTGSYPVSRN